MTTRRLLVVGIAGVVAAAFVRAAGNAARGSDAIRRRSAQERDAVAYGDRAGKVVCSAVDAVASMRTMLERILAAESPRMPLVNEYIGAVGVAEVEDPDDARWAALDGLLHEIVYYVENPVLRAEYRGYFGDDELDAKVRDVLTRLDELGPGRSSLRMTVDA